MELLHTCPSAFAHVNVPSCPIVLYEELVPVHLARFCAPLHFDVFVSEFCCCLHAHGSVMFLVVLLYTRA